MNKVERAKSFDHNFRKIWSQWLVWKKNHGLMRLRNVHFVLLLQANEFVKLCLDNGAYHFDTASMSVNYSILLTHSPINREMWTLLFSFFVICFAFENFLIFLRDQNLGVVICSIFFFYRYASGKSEEIMGNNESLNIEPKVHVKSLLEKKYCH